MYFVVDEKIKDNVNVPAFFLMLWCFCFQLNDHIKIVLVIK